MSSTSRGAKRLAHDYYATPVPLIREFLMEWMQDEPDAKSALRGIVLDPCAGGNRTHVTWEYKPAKTGKRASVVEIPPSLMPYPVAVEMAVGAPRAIITNDVREDSPAPLHGDCLGLDFLGELALAVSNAMPLRIAADVDVVITNPPFARALEIIQRMWGVTREGGFVIMLLRLNWMGSRERSDFLQRFLPERIYVHRARPSFLPTGETDSIEYAHYVWRVSSGAQPAYSKLRVI